MVSELAGRGWVAVSPPERGDPQSVVARYDGEPIKAGFTMEKEADDGESYFKFRSGKYDVELKIDFEIGRGQVRVVEADGYD